MAPRIAEITLGDGQLGLRDARFELIQTISRDTIAEAKKQDVKHKHMGGLDELGSGNDNFVPRRGESALRDGNKPIQTFTQCKTTADGDVMVEEEKPDGQP